MLYFYQCCDNACNQLLSRSFSIHNESADHAILYVVYSLPDTSHTGPSLSTPAGKMSTHGTSSSPGDSGALITVRTRYGR